MIAVFETYDMAFVGVPKCMTTSVLRSFYQCEHGAAFDRTAFGGNIHRYYRQVAGKYASRHEPPDLTGLGAFWAFTILRNPIKRLLSVYTNRVLGHRDVEKALARTGEQGLDPMPGPDAFFRDLDLYRALVPSIRHHTDPFAQFLGPDMARYDAVFHVEDVARLRLVLSQRMGQPLVLENEQRSRQSLVFADLSHAAREKIITHTQGDFELLHAHYSLEHSLRALQGA